MSIGNVVVSQDAPAKNNLWIQPKGTARFWNGSIWKAITGNGGGGGDDYYTKTESDTRFFLNSNINGVSGYATKFTGPKALTYANDYIRIGDGIIYWDAVSSGFRIYHSDLLTNPSSTSKAGVYADWVSAFGANSSGGGGGGGMNETALWQELTGDPQWTLGDDKIININHLPNNINADTVDGYHANSFAFANGTNATGTWGISISGNATSATTATYDSDGNTISSTYLPLSGGTMTGNINTLSLFPVLKDTYSLGSETLNYTRIFGNVIYPGNNNNLWLKSNATSGSAYGIVFGYGGVSASTTLGKWTYTGLGIGTDSPAYKLDVRGTSYFNSTMTVTSTGSNRATLKLKTYGDYPNDFILGTNDIDRWSITCRESSDGGLGFYNYIIGAYRMKILQNGNVGIGTTSPPQKLSVDGNIYTSGGVTALQTVSSDKRLKKNIKKFKAKDIIDKLNPVSFEWNNKAKKLSDFKDGTNYGLIAQDSDGIIDNLVFDLPDGKGYKGVRYEKLIPILLQAVKEQQSEINELKQIIKDLKYEIFNKGNS